MATITINKTPENIIKSYYVKYFIKKDSKNTIKDKLESISLKYSKTWKQVENISDIDKKIYLK